MPNVPLSSISDYHSTNYMLYVHCYFSISSKPSPAAKPEVCSPGCWGSTYFSVPLQLMGLRRSSSLSFRISWERVSALSLQLCSISCTHTHKHKKTHTAETGNTLQLSPFICLCIRRAASMLGLFSGHYCERHRNPNSLLKFNQAEPHFTQIDVISLNVKH